MQIRELKCYIPYFLRLDEFEALSILLLFSETHDQQLVTQHQHAELLQR